MLDNTCGKILGHSFMQNTSNSLIFLWLLLWTALLSWDYKWSAEFKSGDWEAIIKPWFCFTVAFSVCFRFLSCWKNQPQPRFSLLAKATRFFTKNVWSWMKSIMPLSLTRVPGPLEKKQASKHQRAIIVFYCGYVLLLVCISIFLCFCRT